MDTLGKRLKNLRSLKKKESSKFTQDYAANLIGVARSTYTAYENDTKQPPIETVSKLADLYEVSLDYLISGKEHSDWDSKLPELTPKDERDIAKKLENIIDSMDSDTPLSFNGEPMDDETKDLVRAAIESNLMLTKQLAKKKFTPNKFRKE